MRLYNTLTRRIEDFAPLRDDTVRMYACGLTVYARGHIGNFRTFVCLDVLRRALRHVGGHRMRQVVNFTDVDDKTIAGARKAGVPLREYTDRYIAAFREDAEALGIEPAEETPRATDEANLRAMVETIQALEGRGTPIAATGLSISGLPAWPTTASWRGSIMPACRTARGSTATSTPRTRRGTSCCGRRRNRTSRHGTTGVGPGRPGWHIECSAMALRLLDGSPIDIHAGGVDLIFPHHENEIAQSEGSTGEQFARFWVHVEHLLLGRDVKMSKSLGNVLNVRDVLDQGLPGVRAALRVAVDPTTGSSFASDGTAWRRPREALRRLMDCLARLDAVTAPGAREAIAERAQAALDAFRARIADDLNTPGAIGVMFELVRDVNTAIDAGELGSEDVRTVREAFDRFDDVLGVIALRRREEAAPPVDVAEIERLIEERRSARRQRDFARRGLYPRRARRPRNRARGHAGRYALEAEVARPLRWPAVCMASGHHAESASGTSWKTG